MRERERGRSAVAALVRLFVRERGSWRLHISAHYFTLSGSIINCKCASLWLKLAVQQTHAHTRTHAWRQADAAAAAAAAAGERRSHKSSNNLVTPRSTQAWNVLLPCPRLHFHVRVQSSGRPCGAHTCYACAPLHATTPTTTTTIHTDALAAPYPRHM